MKDERDITKDRESATGTAVARAGGKIGTTDIESQRTEAVTGFSPFRYWANSQLRRLPGAVTLDHAGRTMTVEEITNDGQIRLANDEGGFNLVPLDERYIPALLKQLLPRE